MESPISFTADQGNLMAVAASNGSQLSSFQGSQAFLRSVLGSMVRLFLEKHPAAKSVLEAIQSVESEQISFDHLAFRALRVNGNGIESLESFFLDHGYTVGEDLNFPTKKVRARWLSPPDFSVPQSVAPNGLNGPLPRVFISELLVDELSQETQEMLKKHVNANRNGNQYGALSCALATSTWDKPSSVEYKQLAMKNEYGAWTAVHGRALNHVAVSAHRMKSHLRDISNLNRFLEQNGFKMNHGEWVLKVSSDGLLLQSSTVAEKIPIRFADGVTESIPCGFVEFVERLVLPQYKDLPDEEIKEFHRREGFEVGNAFKLLDSVFKEQNA